MSTGMKQKISLVISIVHNPDIIIFDEPTNGLGAVAIPTGIISAGFVEQYQRKSSLSNLKNADIKQIAEIFVDKRYAGKSIEEVEEQEQLTIFLILREDLSILPQKDTLLKQGDIIIIRAEAEEPA